MSTLTLPNVIANGTPADGTKVQQNYETIANYANTETIVRDGTVGFSQPIAGQTPTAAAHLATKDYVDTAVTTAAALGDIKMTAATTAPAKWLFCRGQAISRATYSDLFAAIGTAYGAGDGSTTFNVPNLMGRSPIGYSTSTAGFFGTLGAVGGAYAPTVLDHAHNMTHGHAGSATASDGAHTHTVASRENMNAGGADGAAMESNTTGTASTITTSSSGAHTHGVSVATHEGNTGTSGSGDQTWGNVHPSTTVNFLIFAGV